MAHPLSCCISQQWAALLLGGRMVAQHRGVVGFPTMLWKLALAFCNSMEGTRPGLERGSTEAGGVGLSVVAVVSGPAVTSGLAI